MKKFEMPHLDRAVGERPEHQLDFEIYLTKKFLQKSEEIRDFELEKTSREEEIIEFADRSAAEFLQEYGRRKNIHISLDKIHVLKKDGVKELTDGSTKEAGASSVLLTVIIDRCDSDIDFALRTFHELFHLKSYKALQKTASSDSDADNRLMSYRAGFSVMTRDGKTRYFENFEEAIVGMMTQKFYKEKLLTSPLFKDEVEKLEEEPYISRQGELKELNDLVDKLWEANPEDFSDRDKIMDLFIDAQVNGRLLKVARLVEKTFGKGSFRKLGTEKS